jgi:two-component system, OmpR family, sensor histidine kinase TctE
MKFRLSSLEMRLAVRLAALYVVATTFAIAVLVYQAYDTAGTLNDRDLHLRAADLARYVQTDDKGEPQLNLPENLSKAYQSATSDIFAVRSKEGRVVASIPDSFGEVVGTWPIPTDDASYFQLKSFGAHAQDYYGLSIAVPSAAGTLSISAARVAETSALIRSLLREFLLDAAWLIPVFIALTLLTGIYVIRSGLRPVRDISERAAAIGPSSTSVRLPEHDLPSELVPLVGAVNRALDRLAQGFAVQREFTANAAHELRTPLTIITAALETMGGNGELTKLRSDVARMNRIVEQLLRVARLDAIGLNVSGSVDLKAIAEDTVSVMAPLALAQDRSIAFSPSDEAVIIRGNGHAIADAIRNLLENALSHSPAHAEVTVSVLLTGGVSVVDQGPGISTDDREHIFQRFWRGRAAPSGGAGLGLAIVKEIVNVHGGRITVDVGAKGGSVFTLYFKLAEAAVGVSPPNFEEQAPSVMAN